METAAVRRRRSQCKSDFIQVGNRCSYLLRAWRLNDLIESIDLSNSGLSVTCSQWPFEFLSGYLMNGHMASVFHVSDEPYLGWR
jgi:hypothetical protein